MLTNFAATECDCDDNETCVKLTNIQGGLKEENPDDQELPFEPGMVYNKCWDEDSMAFLADMSKRRGKDSFRFKQIQYERYWYNFDLDNRNEFFTAKDMEECP